MRKELFFVFVFTAFSQALWAQLKQYTQGGHPEDSVYHLPHRVLDGNSTLGFSYLNQNICGLNYIEVDTLVETRSQAALINTNGTGWPCTVQLKGLPICDSIIKAFIWWETSYNSGPAIPASLTVTNPVAANFNYNVDTIGESVPQNWGDIGTATYREDITNSISGNGAYTINITGAGNSGTEVDGICIIVIYKDLSATYSGNLALWDGCYAECTSGVTLNYTGGGFNVCSATTNAVAFGLFGDMQANISGGINTQTYNGSTQTFSNNFWNFCAIPTTLTTGQTTCVFDTYTNDAGDCYGFNLAGLYWQNTNCITCTVSGTPLTLTTTQVNPACGASNGSITANVSGGNAPYTYLWSNGATTSTISNLPPGADSVTVRDTKCGVASITVHLINQSATTITGTSANIPCFGGNTGSASILSVSGSTGPYTYTWTPNVSTTSDATGLTAGMYTVAIADALGCSHDTTFVITQPAQIRDSISKFTNITCNGLSNGTATVAVQGGTKPYAYTWSNTQTSSTATTLGVGTFTITIKDANGCSADTTVTITEPTAIRDSISAITNVKCYGAKTGTATVGVKGGTPPYTYAWSNTQNTITATGLITGFYTVTVTDANGCTDTAIAHITQPAEIRDSVTAEVTQVCPGSGATGNATVGVTGGVGPYTYSWSNGETTASDTGLGQGTYTLTLTDANGCTGPPVTITITATPPLAVTAGPPSSFCEGSNAAISAKGSGGDGTYTYTWAPGNITGQSIIVNPNVTTVYTVTLTDGCGTKPVTATVNVNVNAAPVVAFTADTAEGCYPLCVSFTNGTTIAAPGNIKTWEWSFGNGDTAMSRNPKVCYKFPGQYTITLITISDSGCQSQLFIKNMITVYDHPHANFTASPQPADILQPQINFTDLTIDQYGISSWFWLFGDINESSSALQNPMFTYNDTGTYCPTLVVTNIHNCTDSVEKCIVIEPHFTLYIPDAFTPNNDHVDDIFKAEGIYICSFEMWIFDRWGMQMYHGTDINQGWNGVVQGGSKEAQEDTYVYLIKAQDCRGEHEMHQYVGKVTLIR